MINHINKNSLDILTGTINQHVDNIFSQKPIFLLQIEGKKD